MKGFKTILAATAVFVLGILEHEQPQIVTYLQSLGIDQAQTISIIGVLVMVLRVFTTTPVFNSTHPAEGDSK
jgi:hypothetical protein